MSGNDPNQINLKDAQQISLQIITSARDLIEETFANSDGKLHDKTLSTLRRLMSYASGRSQCASFLISNHYLWDTEIILRSFYEAIAKVMFICQHPTENADELANEFWGDYREAEDKLTTNRSQIALKLASRAMQADDVRVFEALSVGGVLTETKMNRPDRQKVRRKWSFTEIVDVLDNKIEGASALVHIYSVQSHLCHADNIALDYIYDHVSRSIPEAQLKEASHICRILSDQAYLWYFAAYSIGKVIGTKFDHQEFKELFKKLSDEIDPITEAFNRSQDEFYNSL